ncbi:hypothetical protein GCM10027413_14780 [Conyzicola nivalis]|uniref:N-acetyltransferase domain-containing protein n=1 Tax=Conyzicola nivalis TaxID=1477021 RepID=A0A916SJ95_9MICO|nr:GNAT family N-acetyltransferase [Conyzicola nivalis]GGA98961.1 hypothetical protein GCM10010979_11840 [Conyzicola nivalis]
MTVVVRPVAAEDRSQWERFFVAYGEFYDPSARGTGTATTLIDAVTERARAAGGGTLRWITAADNVTAQRVYDRVADRSTWVTYERKT